MSVHYITFNPFYENTYIVAASNGDAAIIDPGCFTPEEEQELSNYIKKEGLMPKYLLNTHTHIDHVLGNNFVADTYNLSLRIHQEDLELLEKANDYGASYGLKMKEQVVKPKHYLQENDIIKFGDIHLEVRHVPGHAPGHVVFVNHSQKFIIAGDTLFKGSVGRTDLFKGDQALLISSIKEKLLSLSDDYRVYCGHGSMTTIGNERATNPFLI